MDWDDPTPRHLSKIPKSVRREPINLSRCDHQIRLSIILALVPVILVAISALVIFFARPAYPRELTPGQWAQNDPETSAWYKRQMMPDHPKSPCCGEADAYWADEVHVDTKGNVIAVVTDDRDDVPLGRSPVPMGTRYIVPANKVVDARVQGGNPTGHTIIFLSGVSWDNNTSYPERRAVLCFILGWGT